MDGREARSHGVDRAAPQGRGRRKSSDEHRCRPQRGSARRVIDSGCSVAAFERAHGALQLSVECGRESRELPLAAGFERGDVHLEASRFGSDSPAATAQYHRARRARVQPQATPVLI